MKTGPGVESEGVGAGTQDGGAEDVGGHQVGSGLHALEAEAEQAAERLDHQGLGDAWNALEQRVPLAENGDQHFFDDLRLAGDDAAQFGRAWAISSLVARSCRCAAGCCAGRLQVCVYALRLLLVQFLAHEGLSVLVVSAWYRLISVATCF